jgi:hypothetical protein
VVLPEYAYTGRGKMSKEITLSMLTKELKRFGILPDSKEYVVGLTLLAALQTRANADAVARFIKCPRKDIREIGKRLRSNGIWQGSKTCCEWFRENGSIAFRVDCCVGMGWMGKCQGGDQPNADISGEDK